jgi:hypothetical protein
MDDILSEIQAFCETHGLTESQFGRLSNNDTWLIKDVREGRELRRRTIAKIRTFMATYRPAEARAA